MCNKDFLRQIVSGEKELMTRSEIRTVDVPAYDELSVCNLWPIMKQNEAFTRHFPDTLPIGRLPSREYFFNILNTGMNEYL